MTTDEDVPVEKRKNVLLRMLIDDMLEQVRDLHRESGPWSSDERTSAEQALERIMTQVRSEASKRGNA